MHHRSIELVSSDLACRADVHFACHAQALHRRLQRTKLVRQRLGQHRNDAARKIDGRAAIARVTVESIAVAHVMRDICDRHDQPEAFALALAKHCVVEILRRFPVDRDERQRSEIDALLAVARPHFLRQAVRLPLRGNRELMRQVVLAERNLDLHARVRVAAQHFDDAHDRLPLR